MRIGIDLGGTTIKAALCGEGGVILRRANAPTPAGDENKLKDALKALALQLVDEHGIKKKEISGIGIGVPGSIDEESCILLFGTNLGLENVCFGNTFEPEFSCRVKLGNDANCAALGEATLGSARGVKNMIMITLGTGVGGGIVVNHELYTGCNGIAGELGHIVIHQDGEQCNCGRKGCLEAYASAASLVKFAERALNEGRDSCLKEQKGNLDGKIICDAVDAGDPLAKELFDQYCKNLACGISNFINIFQPDCIVLGGGLAGYGDKLINPLKEIVGKDTFRFKDKNTNIVCASLGNDAGLIGAAML